VVEMQRWSLSVPGSAKEIPRTIYEHALGPGVFLSKPPPPTTTITRKPQLFLCDIGPILLWGLVIHVEPT
jgi:hypothetical protein